ncbi:MAG: polysaccharide deacetylase family protein [Clostridia bacterium]|nr:polysaccharide deacetylase family protein [Clostridia bacterium]
MKEKIVRHSFVFGLLLACIFQFSLYSQATTLSNELLAWGFKRGENHEQAILDTKSENVIKKYNGISLGNKEKANIYLTFDCGYEGGYTESILNVLEKYDVKATFFITGHYLNSASDLVKKMIEDGHIVGNHTVNHKCLPNISDDEIENEIMKLHNSLYEKFGYEMKFFRPPKGEFSERVIKQVQDLNYITVMWSSAYDDWDDSKQGRVEYGKKKVLDNLHNGCVLLLHSTSKDNAQILEEVIIEARNMGYEFKSLNEFEK